MVAAFELGLGLLGAWLALWFVIYVIAGAVMVLEALVKSKPTRLPQ
jgi:hypothetical protein